MTVRRSGRQVVAAVAGEAGVVFAAGVGLGIYVDNVGLWTMDDLGRGVGVGRGSPVSF